MKTGSVRNVPGGGMRLGALVLCALLSIALPPTADAAVVYTYTGKPFTSIWGDYSCVDGVGVCQIKGYFVLPQIPASYSFGDIVPSSWMFTDGQNVFSSADTTRLSYFNFKIATDSLGSITRWYLTLRVGFIPHRILITVNDPFSSWIGDWSGHSRSTPGSMEDGLALNTEPGSWSVAVSTTDMIQRLIDTVATFNLQQGIANGLDAKLTTARAALRRARSGDTASACGMLTGFVHEVEAQSGNALTASQAAELTFQASLLQAALGCQ